MHEKKVIYLHFTTTTSKQKEDEKEDKSYTAHGEKKGDEIYYRIAFKERGKNACTIIDAIRDFESEVVDNEICYMKTYMLSRKVRRYFMLQTITDDIMVDIRF